MKIKRIMLVTLVLLAILTISAVSASDDLKDNLTVQFDEKDVMEMPISENSNESSPINDDVLSRVVTSDNNSHNGSCENSQPVLGSKLEGSDIKVNVNTKSIDASDGNSIIANIQIPKGHTAYLDMGGYLGDHYFKLSELPIKKTKNGITTYTIRLKDLKNYNIENLANNKLVDIDIKYYNTVEKSYDYMGSIEYVLKFNKKAKTFKLKKRIWTQIWIGNYDRKSGTNKILTVHLGIPTVKKPLCDSKSKHIAGKKVKITINGVVYNKKTNSKGLVYIYPPKYLPPKAYTKVKMEFAGDSKYCECSGINDIEIYKNQGSSKSKIKANSKTFSLNNTKKYTVKLISKGKAVKKAKLKLTVNGKNYVAKTNSKGDATFNLSIMNKGKFKATILYMGDKKHYMSYKDVKLTVK